MDEFFNAHYLAVDERSRITGGWSDGPHPGRDTAGAVLLNGKGGYQFRLFPGGEENPALCDDLGVPLYSWDGTQIVRRTREEIEADRAEVIAQQEPPVDFLQKLEEFNTANQLAIAELAEALLGGV